MKILPGLVSYWNLILQVNMSLTVCLLRHWFICRTWEMWPVRCLGHKEPSTGGLTRPAQPSKRGLTRTAEPHCSLHHPCSTGWPFPGLQERVPHLIFSNPGGDPELTFLGNQTAGQPSKEHTGGEDFSGTLPSLDMARVGCSTCLVVARNLCGLVNRL